MTSSTVLPVAGIRLSEPGNSATSDRGRWTVAGRARRQSTTRVSTLQIGGRLSATLDHVRPSSAEP